MRAYQNVKFAMYLFSDYMIIKLMRNVLSKCCSFGVQDLDPNDLILGTCSYFVHGDVLHRVCLNTNQFNLCLRKTNG